jgi:hypothetical protein
MHKITIYQFDQLANLANFTDLFYKIDLFDLQINLDTLKQPLMTFADLFGLILNLSILPQIGPALALFSPSF